MTKLSGRLRFSLGEILLLVAFVGLPTSLGTGEELHSCGVVRQGDLAERGFFEVSSIARPTTKAADHRRGYDRLPVGRATKSAALL
jgi:hypothetical protein